MKLRTVSLLLIAGLTMAASASPAAAWWQFVAMGPNGERQVSPHYNSEQECKSALKATESRLAKKYPERYPLVGSCEAYK
jgi:hypothetical protein